MTALDLIRDPFARQRAVSTARLMRLTLALDEADDPTREKEIEEQIAFAQAELDILSIDFV